MNDGSRLIFLGGLHRSGTSLLHEILRSHPTISGFANTGVPEDEGQHLQNVYLPAKAFGGPGRFGFDRASFMDEQHPLAKVENAARLLQQWSRYWDTAKPYLIEKSPPNLVRTRFLQQLFPGCRFIIILRHPIAVAYATRKWSGTGIPSLLEHSLRCYERFREDLCFLNNAYVLRYEEFVLEPHRHVQSLLDWIGIEAHEFHHEVRRDVNAKYFDLWRSDRRNRLRRLLSDVAVLLQRGGHLERRANAFGYRMDPPEELLPVDWLGSREPAPAAFAGCRDRSVQRAC